MTTAEKAVAITLEEIKAAEEDRSAWNYTDKGRWHRYSAWCGPFQLHIEVDERLGLIRTMIEHNGAITKYIIKPWSPWPELRSYKQAERDIKKRLCKELRDYIDLGVSCEAIPAWKAEKP